MKLFIISYALLILLVTCSNQFQADNTPPIISKITITPAQPTINQIATLKVFATDADDDELLYKWTVSGGALTNNGRGNPIYYSTPNSIGIYVIVCYVSDGIEIVTKSTGVDIQDESGSIIEEPE